VKVSADAAMREVSAVALACKKLRNAAIEGSSKRAPIMAA
jgi:hypothetical protein